ncbi:uncharacterized protein LOC122652135 [Telopea speciosissima]|uniref:uncharacterized protein LOC122652135 n=1 Tax=Telopea speciosissima TaxID=54955 RepID=UPI001CC5210A|nr:uncharacterized protein LOC122652135 [Telopea speciosissima]
MALSSVKLVSLSPLVASSRQPRPKRLTVLGLHRSPPVQVNSEMYCQQRLPPQSINSSRRDVVLRLMIASLAAINILSVESVDARNVKPEIRRKIKEKLEMLREKAGITKSQSEDKSSSDKGKMLASPPPTLYPQDILGGSLVETTFPDREITS